MCRIFRIIRIAQNLSYFELGYAWILTEETINESGTVDIDAPPTGLLAIEGNEVNKYFSILKDVVSVTR